jgi:cyclopropane-fatty-acyl-phospholipid synthase
VGEKLYRIWRIYMAGSAHGFERGWMSVYQVLAGKPLAGGALELPGTRDHIYARQE